MKYIKKFNEGLGFKPTYMQVENPKIHTNVVINFDVEFNESPEDLKPIITDILTTLGVRIKEIRGGISKFNSYKLDVLVNNLNEVQRIKSELTYKLRTNFGARISDITEIIK